MKISDMPEFRDKSEVLSFEETTGVGKVIDEMAAKNYGAVLATRKGKVVGIFTERDILKKIAAKRLDIKKTKLKDVMTAKLKTASINDKVTDSMRRMSQGRFRHMPILDDNGNILGMLSQGDFVAFTMGDIVGRMGTAAKAGISEGRSTPFAIIAAILAYTIGLILILTLV